MFKILTSIKRYPSINRNFSMCRILLCEEKQKPKESKRKVKEDVELITLVDQNDKILGLKPKKESELLAKRLNLSLERVTDPKYGKTYPAYRLFSAAELLQSEKKTTTAKTLKKLPINSRISDHDLNLKLKTIRKWLSKNCEVHVAILSNNESSATMKNVLSKMQEQLAVEARILNIRHKEEVIKFIVLPPKENTKKVPIDEKKEILN